MELELQTRDLVIVTGTEPTDSEYNSPDALKQEIDELFHLVSKAKPSARERVSKLIAKYPNVVRFRNLLSMWYYASGKIDQGNRVNNETLRLFPDYLFARTARSRELLSQGKPVEAFAMLRNTTDIREFAPNRKIFHISEYTAFTVASIDCLMGLDRMDEARALIDDLRKNGVNKETIDLVSQTIMGAPVQKNLSKMQQMRESDIEAEERTETTIAQVDGELEIPRTCSFLDGDLWDIDAATLSERIDTGREAFVEALRGIVHGAIAHYSYCSTNEEWSPAVLHSLSVLAYIDDERSFGLMIEYLRQPYDCMQFWTSDWADSFIEPFMARFTEEKLAAIYGLVIEEGVSSHAKNMLLENLFLFAKDNPDNRNAVVACIAEILAHFEDNHDNSRLFDSTVLAFAVSAAADLRAENLMPVIERLYEKKYVSRVVDGDVEDVRKIMTEGNSRTYEEPIADLFDFIEHKRSIAARNRQRVERKEVKPKPQLTPSFKAPQNAPCPCGSGKKFKRCHGA